MLRSWCLWSITLCLVVVCSALEPIATPAGVYTPATNVSNVLQFSQWAADIKSMLFDTMEESDWASVQTLYDETLGVVALTNHSGAPIYEDYAENMGNFAFNRYATQQLTVTQWINAQRIRSLKAYVSDAIPFFQLSSSLYRGTACTSDEPCPEWDEGAAVYIGNLVDSPYAEAEKQGDIFGTINADGVAEANIAVLTLLNTGPSMSAYFGIIDRIYSVYCQSMMHTAWLMDEALAATPRRELRDIQGLGYAFFRIVLPPFKSADELAYNRVELTFKEVAAGYNKTDNYCLVSEMTRVALPELAPYAGALTPVDGKKCPLNTVAGTYRWLTDISPALGVSEAVAEIKTLLNETNPEWAQVKEIYDQKLRPYATRNHAGEPIFDLYAAHFDEAFALHKEIISFLENDTVEHIVRARKLETSTSDTLAVMEAISALYRGSKNATTDDWIAWDEGAALYIGNTENSPYARAISLAEDFGVFEERNIDKYVNADANVAVLEALRNGPSESAYFDIVDQFKVIYTQATLRSAALLDATIERGLSHQYLLGNQTEGGVFFNNIAPWIALNDSIGSAKVQVIFEPNANYDTRENYCIIKSILLTALPEVLDGLGLYVGDFQSACGIYTSPSDAIGPLLYVACGIAVIMSVSTVNIFTLAATLRSCPFPRGLCGMSVSDKVAALTLAAKERSKLMGSID